MKRQVYLRSKVARRVAGMFLLSAVVPVVVLATLTLRRVSTDLRTQAVQRLDRQSRSVGVMVIDRLMAADERARHFLADHGRGEVDTTAMRAAGVAWLARRLPDGTWHPMAGAAPAMVALPPKALARVQAGRSWLGLSDRDLMLAVSPTGGDTIVMAGIEPTRIWGADEINPLNPAATTLCIRSAAGATLHERPDGGCDALVAEASVAGDWTAFLGFLFGAASWQISLAEPAALVTAPVTGFSSAYVWVGLLTFAVVFVLASAQIRRQLGPLDALAAGTERLAVGDFDHRVVVASNDEFEQVARSFNTMAGSLDRHVGLLTSLQSLNNVALASPAPGPVVGATLTTLRRVLPGINAVVAVAPGAASPGWQLFGRDGWADDEPQQLRLRSGSLQAVELSAAPMCLAPDSTLAEDLALPRDVPATVLGLRAGGDLRGIIAVFRPGPLDDDEAARLAAVGAQSAVALHNARLVDRLDEMSWGALKALARTIDANSPWTAGHSERVTAIAVRIATAMRLTGDEIEVIHRGGLLHDIGKIGVPGAVLDKQGPLTGDERAVIQRHPEIGAQILGPLSVFAPVLPLVRWHHEALDGSGYPDGLRGDQIPMNVRILTVADVFEALTADRPYRSGWAVADALALLRRETGHRFDPEPVRAWAGVLEAQPLAEVLRLPVPNTAYGEPAVLIGSAGA